MTATPRRASALDSAANVKPERARRIGHLRPCGGQIRASSVHAHRSLAPVSPSAMRPWVPGAVRSTDGHEPAHGRGGKATDEAGGSGYADRHPASWKLIRTAGGRA